MLAYRSAPDLHQQSVVGARLGWLPYFETPKSSTYPPNKVYLCLLNAGWRFRDTRAKLADICKQVGIVSAAEETYRNKDGIEKYPDQIKTPTQAGYTRGGYLYYDVVGYPARAKVSEHFENQILF